MRQLAFTIPLPDHDHFDVFGPAGYTMTQPILAGSSDTFETVIDQSFCPQSLAFEIEGGEQVRVVEMQIGAKHYHSTIEDNPEGVMSDRFVPELTDGRYFAPGQRIRLVLQNPTDRALAVTVQIGGTEVRAEVQQHIHDQLITALQETILPDRYPGTPFEHVSFRMPPMSIAPGKSQTVGLRAKENYWIEQLELQTEDGTPCKPSEYTEAIRCRGICLGGRRYIGTNALLRDVPQLIRESRQVLLPDERIEVTLSNEGPRTEPVHLVFIGHRLTDEEIKRAREQHLLSMAEALANIGFDGDGDGDPDEGDDPGTGLTMAVAE